MHVDEQPSPFIRFPSSHPAFITIPSPQISIHNDACVGDPPEHENPDSILHADEQPSPLMVFPSSHWSIMTLPSPHI